MERRLLILTQKVNRADPILGFFHRWIEEFAKNAERVHVICLEEGAHDLPRNVTVHSLGKEKGASRAVYVARLFGYAWSLRREYDAVLVHMNPIYLVLAGPLWRVLGKRVALWYTHKTVDWKLRIGSLFAEKIFSASKESFRMKTKKLSVLGHGIDTGEFSFGGAAAKRYDVMTASRISPTKKIDLIVAALELLDSRGARLKAAIIGASAVAGDEEYANALKVRTARFGDRIEWPGSIEHDRMPELLRDADLFINVSGTGSLDKAVLEAMSCGSIPISSNIAFRDTLEPLGLFLEDATAELVADRIEATLGRADKEDLRTSLRAMVVRDHSLSARIPDILIRIYNEAGQ